MTEMTIYKNKFTPGFFSGLKIFIILISLFLSGYAFPQETEKQWTIGAHKFFYTQDVKRGEFENAVLSAIPELILEQLYGTRERIIPDQEVLNREIDKLVKERLSLFLELSSEVKKKDALVLKNLSEYQFDKQTSIQNKKISEIKEKINANLEKQDILLKEFSENKGVFADKNQLKEDFAFYKGEPKELFSFSERIKNIDFKSYECAQEIVNAKIDSLVTGTVVTYGEYAAVTVELFLYPGAQSRCVITEVGRLAFPDDIAKNIAFRLVPVIENSLPCEICVKILPQELHSKTKLTIDSTVYTKIPETVIISAGVHNFSVECEGYKKETFSYGFGYERKYDIEVNLLEENLVETALLLKNPFKADIFYNGNQSPDNQMNVKINNQVILGYVISASGNTMFFKAPGEMVQDKAVLSAAVKDVDIGQKIESSRKLMYISYSALVCSLPFLFYSYSNYDNLYKAYALGSSNTSLEEIDKYRNMTAVSGAITAACGIWFTTQLIIYLVKANKALPVETKKAKVEYDIVVNEYHDLQEKYKEEERLKQEEAEASENIDNENESIEGE